MIGPRLTETLFKKHIFDEAASITAYILAHEIRGSKTPYSTITAPAVLSIPQLIKLKDANLYPNPSSAPIASQPFILLRSKNISHLSYHQLKHHM